MLDDFDHLVGREDEKRSLAAVLNDRSDHASAWGLNVWQGPDHPAPRGPLRDPAQNAQFLLQGFARDLSEARRNIVLGPHRG
jgi:hypothetical protein